MGAIRLFLALVVAADHWRVIVLIPGGNGIEMSDHYKLGFNAGYAVMFFYAISGFLITYTLSRNYEAGIPGALDFYRKRAIRIFSLYWSLAAFAFLAIPSAWPAFLASSPEAKFSAIFLFGLDWHRATGAGGEIVGLQQAWTLGAELTFYAVAPLLMWSWKIGTVLLVGSLAFRIGFVLLHGPALDAIWTYAFPPSTFCFFMGGHLICLAAMRWKVLLSPRLGWTALAASAAAMLWAGNYAEFDGTRLWMATPLFVLCLPAVFDATKGIRWMNAIGDLSYPVYLVHLLPILLVAPWIVSVAAIFGRSGYASTGVFLFMVTAFALVAHRFVEEPIARIASRLTTRRLAPV